MASRESTPAVESAGDSSVRRAAALATLSEEPSAGLFPATATAVSTTATATATATAQSAPAAAEPPTAAAAPTPTASEPEAETGAATEAEAEPEPEAEPDSTPAATTTTAATATTTATTAATATATATRTTAATATTSSSSGTGTGTGTGSGSGTDSPPLGRPNKPMIAAAVLGGLVLIGVPFLVSGSDDNPRTSAAGAPPGSSMHPGGPGPGIVPSEQQLAAPGANKGKGKSEAPVKAPGPDGGRGKGLGPIGGIHESATDVTHGNDGTAPGPRSTSTGTGTGRQTAPPVPGGGTGGTAPAQGRGTQATTPPATKAPVQNPAPTTQPPATTAPQSATYTHLIGLGCETPGFAVGDMYTDGNAGWLKSWGSTKSYGCNGLFYSMPMSGSSRSDGIWAQWKFTTGSVTKGTCAVQVFIPNVRDLSYVGGSPAHYTVYRAFTQSSTNSVGSFEINQASHLGQWVSAGRFPVSDNKISVVLDNRGSGADNRHAAAAPVRVDCTAS
ncbi:hypothetical protein ACWFR1_14830 [Streptomyces sp. NPDC055103]